jgi:hypothetical protein
MKRHISSRIACAMAAAVVLVTISNIGDIKRYWHMRQM